MRSVGLLGGSFNPAHQGHVRLSLFALKRLQLDEAWWLVSPQNPLKPADGMAPLEERLSGARTLAEHPRIRVSDLEAQVGTRFTVDTVERLQARSRQTRYVWLMGADNLAQVHKWHRWRDLFASLPIAVVDRPGSTYRALSSPAAGAMGQWRYTGAATHLKHLDAPAWTFLFGFRDWTSATGLRRQRAGG